MPLIEFRCKECSHEFEELIYRQQEYEKVICPQCSGHECQRLLSTFSMRSSSSFPNSTGSSCTGCTKETCSGCAK